MDNCGEYVAQKNGTSKLKTPHRRHTGKKRQIQNNRLIQSELNWSIRWRKWQPIDLFFLRIQRKCTYRTRWLLTHRTIFSSVMRTRILVHFIQFLIDSNRTNTLAPGRHLVEWHRLIIPEQLLLWIDFKRVLIQLVISYYNILRCKTIQK